MRKIYINKQGVICLRENGVDTPFEDQERAKNFTYQAEGLVKEGADIFPFPRYEVEVKELLYCKQCGKQNCTACGVSAIWSRNGLVKRKVAVLTPVKKEEPKSIYIQAREFIEEMDKRHGTCEWVDHDHTFAEALVEFAERAYNKAIDDAIEVIDQDDVSHLMQAAHEVNKLKKP